MRKLIHCIITPSSKYRVYSASWIYIVLAMVVMAAALVAGIILKNRKKNVNNKGAQTQDQIEKEAILQQDQANQDSKDADGNPAKWVI